MAANLLAKLARGGVNLATGNPTKKARKLLRPNAADDAAKLRGSAERQALAAKKRHARWTEANPVKAGLVSTGGRAVTFGLGGAALHSGISNLASDEVYAAGLQGPNSPEVMYALQQKAMQIQELQLQNAQMLAMRDPHFAQELMVGRTLAPGTQYIGPDQRSSLFDDAIKALTMNQLGVR